MPFAGQGWCSEHKQEPFTTSSAGAFETTGVCTYFDRHVVIGRRRSAGWQLISATLCQDFRAKQHATRSAFPMVLRFNMFATFSCVASSLPTSLTRM